MKPMLLSGLFAAFLTGAFAFVLSSSPVQDRVTAPPAPLPMTTFPPRPSELAVAREIELAPAVVPTPATPSTRDLRQMVIAAEGTPEFDQLLDQLLIRADAADADLLTDLAIALAGREGTVKARMKIVSRIVELLGPELAERLLLQIARLIPNTDDSVAVCSHIGAQLRRTGRLEERLEQIEFDVPRVQQVAFFAVYKSREARVGSAVVRLYEQTADQNLRTVILANAGTIGDAGAAHAILRSALEGPPTEDDELLFSTLNRALLVHPGLSPALVDLVQARAVRQDTSRRTLHCAVEYLHRAAPERVPVLIQQLMEVNPALSNFASRVALELEAARPSTVR